MANLTTDCSAKPQFPVKRTISYDVEVTSFEDEATQSIKTSDTKHLKPIKLVYASQGDTERSDFEAFFDARKGRFETFYWNDARTGESNILVKFVEKEVEFTADGPRTWSWNVSLMRVTT